MLCNAVIVVVAVAIKGYIATSMACVFFVVFYHYNCYLTTILYAMNKESNRFRLTDLVVISTFAVPFVESYLDM